MSRKVGVCFIGMNGAVATTAIAGLILLKKSLVEPIGLISETYLNTDLKTIEQISCLRERKISDLLKLCGFNDIIIGGWDINTKNSVYETSIQYSIIDSNLLKKIKNELSILYPWRPCIINKSRKLVEKVEQIKNDLIRFKKDKKIDRLIVVDLGPTEGIINLQYYHQDLREFNRALHDGRKGITPSMLYAYAALQSNAAFIEFTPNMSIEIPALNSVAYEKNIPIAGKDGKTGQTFIKSVLAQALRSRNLFINGWYSTNILGNNDGKNLLSIENRKAKLKTKRDLLDMIVGYSVPNHIIDIVYYPPRGDNKEAWDNIDVRVFTNKTLQIKINLLGADSILAAPLVIDLIRFMDYSLKNNLKGFQTWLSLYFKKPLNSTICGYFDQERAFINFIMNEIMTEKSEVKI